MIQPHAPATLTPIFAPVGIAHLTTDNTDLLRAAAAGRSQLRVTTAAQLNGSPHLGTIATVLTVFAVAAHAADTLNLQPTVIFDALENAPAERVEIDGTVYTRTVGDLIDTGDLDPASRRTGFDRLLGWAATRSGINYEFRPYAAYQALGPVRECLHRIAADQETFRPLAAPADGRIRIRPRCPACRLMEKSARTLTIDASHDQVHLDSTCPTHGRYRETIHIADRDGWYDANTPVRSIQKGYLLARERDLYDACSVSIDGADWGGAWHAHVLAPALSALGLPHTSWPISLFTPLIVDRTGGKLSKTLYVRHGAYADLPRSYLDLDLLLADHGEQTLEILWNEIHTWAREPRRLHRSYTLDYLHALLATAGEQARHTA
jgi:hypothetical protein